MPRIRFALALATAVVVLCPTLSRADGAGRLDGASDWRDAQDIGAPVSSLEDRLDQATGWSRREAAPTIRLVGRRNIEARRGGGDGQLPARQDARAP